MLCKLSMAEVNAPRKDAKGPGEDVFFWMLS